MRSSLLLVPRSLSCYSIAYDPATWRVGAEGQIARAAADPDLLGVIGDDPVLDVDVPVAQVTASKLSGECGTLTRSNVFKTLEATEDTDRLALTTEADVQLGNLIRGSVTSVGDGGSDGVLAEVAVGRGRNGVSDRGAVRGVADRLDFEIRVLKGSPGQTETELVERSRRVVGGTLSVGAGGLSVKVAVVDEVALDKVLLRGTLSIVGLVENLGAIAVISATPGEGRTSRAGLAVEDVGDGVTGLLSRHTSPNNGGDVGVVVPLDSRDVLDELIALLPQSEVLAVAVVAVNLDVALTRIGIGKDNGGDVGLADKSLCLGPLVVVEDALITSTVLNSLERDALVGGDKVGELRGSGTPCHGKSTVVASTVSATVGSGRVGTSVLSNDSEELGLLKRKSANLEESSHNSGSHVVDSPGGNSTVDNSEGQVSTPEAEASVELGVTRHGHVKTGNSGGGTGVLSLPIAHDETLETHLVLEDAVEELGVLASI
ncbi:hypothetical protein HG531_011342 [Fusarium graminearum]|nr:hypothetical protein HG531_011342 [Fusarium graminearum]